MIGTPPPLRGIGGFRRELVRKGGLEPPRFYPPDPKSGASANSATFAFEVSTLIVTRCRFGARAVFFFPALLLSNAAKLAERRDFTSNLRPV